MSVETKMPTGVLVQVPVTEGASMDVVVRKVHRISLAGSSVMQKDARDYPDSGGPAVHKTIDTSQVSAEWWGAKPAGVRFIVADGHDEWMIRASDNKGSTMRMLAQKFEPAPKVARGSETIFVALKRLHESLDERADDEVMKAARDLFKHALLAKGFSVAMANNHGDQFRMEGKGLVADTRAVAGEITVGIGGHAVSKKSQPEITRMLLDVKRTAGAELQRRFPAFQFIIAKQRGFPVWWRYTDRYPDSLATGLVVKPRAADESALLDEANANIDVDKAALQKYGDIVDDHFRDLMTRGEDYAHDASNIEKNISDAVQEFVVGTRKGMAEIVKRLRHAVGNIPSWNGSRITIKPSYSVPRHGDIYNPFPYRSNTDYDSRGVVDATVYVHGSSMKASSPSFTFFGGAHVPAKDSVDDVLDAGDTDFFDDPKIEKDYFDLVGELRAPGSQHHETMMTLWTARPKRDRAR